VPHVHIYAVISDMTKTESESLFVNPFSDEISSVLPDETRLSPEISYEIEQAANEIASVAADVGLPREEDAAQKAIFDISQASFAVETRDSFSTEGSTQPERDLIISFRAAFQGFIVSVVDSAPTEICVVTLKNVNALATWNILRTTSSTVYFTITRVQIDNMIPNAPYPVAVSPMALNTRDTTTVLDDDSGGQDESNPPILVIGISFAPRHKSGTVVSMRRQLLIFCILISW